VPDDIGAPVGTPIEGTLAAGRTGVNRTNPLCGKGFSIVAGGTCDDERPVWPGFSCRSVKASIRTRSSLGRFEAVRDRGKEVAGTPDEPMADP
jgi:hypothetical protein